MKIPDEKIIERESIETKYGNYGDNCNGFAWLRKSYFASRLVTAVEAEYVNSGSY